MKPAQRCLFTTKHIVLLVIFLTLTKTALTPIAQTSTQPATDRDTNLDATAIEQPSTIFSANFAPGNVAFVRHNIFGHNLPSYNALTDNNGGTHHTFTLNGVEYTVSDFTFYLESLYFELKSGSEHTDERTVLADYSLKIVNENDETFTQKIKDFEDTNNNWVRILLPYETGSNPFKSTGAWDDWIRDSTITVSFSIVETSSLGINLDFDGNGTFTPSQDALSLYLVTQLSATANTLASYVYDGSSETAGNTITLINSLTKDTSLDFDGSGAFVASQDALALYLSTQLSATANTLASYVYDRSSVTAATTITLINNLVIRTNG